MRSTSCSILAQDVLDRCVAGKPPKELPRALVEEPCGKALFGILAEGLADRFEAALCDAYARLFSQAVAYASPTLDAASLVARYERIRRTRPVVGKPHRIFVLSRVTLGADVAVTSVLLTAAKRRFSHAEVVFIAPRKNYELFAGDPHIHHAPIEYRRGSLGERLAVWDDLRTLLSAPDCIVVDPDSRLTQLGLIPVCAEERYHLFESRAYGADSNRNLSQLAADWAAETFGTPGCRPYIALGRKPARAPLVAVSLGVGENPSKRLPDPFEVELFKMLSTLGTLCLDKGAGGEEAKRVEQAAKQAGIQPMFWEGSFAGFAAIITASSLYVGYDSAGQHVAAACGIPLISIFAGFPVPRMFERWRPVGPHCDVIRVDRSEVDGALRRVEDAVRRRMPRVETVAEG